MSADQDFYATQVHYLDIPNYMDSHVATMRSYLARYKPDIARLATKKKSIRTLELGAGTCTLSLLLSRESWVES